MRCIWHALSYCAHLFLSDTIIVDESHKENLMNFQIVQTEGGGVLGKTNFL